MQTHKTENNYPQNTGGKRLPKYGSQSETKTDSCLWLRTTPGQTHRNRKHRTQNIECPPQLTPWPNQNRDIKRISKVRVWQLGYICTNTESMCRGTRLSQIPFLESVFCLCSVLECFFRHPGTHPVWLPGNVASWEFWLPAPVSHQLSAHLVLIIISPLHKPGPDIHSLPDRKPWTVCWAIVSDSSWI